MLVLTIAIIGAGGIIAQTILLRELLISFLGNELTLGLILGSWMLGEALGALTIGRIAERIKNRNALLIALLAAFALTLCLSVAGIRLFKPLLGIPVGQGIGTGMIFLCSFLLMLPVSFSHGGLFSAACSVSTTLRAYILETAGTLLGGIALTWLIIPNFTHLEIIRATALMSVAACVFLLRPVKSLLLKAILYPLVLACLAAVLIMKPAQVEQYTLSRQYRQGKVIDYRNSWYGNIVVSQKEGQKVFFYNGVPAVTTPVPELIWSREFSHLPLLFCDNPKNVMVVNAGLGGLISEILKEPVDRVDYCQQDSLPARMLWKYPSKLTQMELTDTRLNVIHKDARVVLRDARITYDTIIIGSTVPGDLSSNRFFTDEFFSLVRSRLNPSGVLALCLPGSLTYISPELRDMNQTILNGLNRHFGRVRVIPGDYNIILASDTAVLSIEPSILYSRLHKRKVKVTMLNPGYLKSRLHGQWIEWFRRSASGGTQQVNRDDKPLAVYQVLILWNKQFSGTTMMILQFLSHLRFWMILFVIAAIGAMTVGIARLWPRRATQTAVLYAITTMGFFGMAMNLALIFSFQIHYGYVYQMIAALTAMFTAGTAAGSIVLKYMTRLFLKPITGFIANEIAAGLFAVITYYVIIHIDYGIFLTPVYCVLCFISGAFVGASFPLAVSLYGKKGQAGARASGVVFCADLVGGVVAAILAGVVLLPLIGIANVIIALAVLKSTAALNIMLIKNMK